MEQMKRFVLQGGVKRNPTQALPRREGVNMDEHIGSPLR
jgi:hypothetical protein